MKKKNMKVRIFGGVAFGAFALALFLSILSLSNTVKEISEVAISKSPTAILASSGVSDGRAISVPVLYYDQKMDECVNIYDSGMHQAVISRQFEWSECNYLYQELEQGIVDFELNDEYLPVAIGGKVLTNRGLSDMTRWFSAVEGKSSSYAGTIKLEYSANDAVFSFSKKDFYPLDEAEFSKDDTVNNDGHNHLFTMNFAVPFTTLLSGDETFEVQADDDTFVFVGDKLVLDMGGIHKPITGIFTINSKGEIYNSIGGETLAYSGVNVDKDSSSIVRIFHADRDSSESTFSVRFTGMNLAVVDTKVAENGEDGIQVAYDPTDPSYVAPLGESVVFTPSNSKGLIIIATVEGAMLIVFSFFTVIMARNLIKSKARK